jgi:peptidoglycan lytic transglycosylase
VNKRVFALAIVLALGSQAAWAEPISQRVRDARTQQATALDTLRTLEGQVQTVRGQLVIAEHLLDAATVQLVDAQSQARDDSVKLALARDVLVQRVRAAYEQGPDTALTMIFSARSPSDLLSINEFTSRAMLSDIDVLNQVRHGRAIVAREQAGLQLRQNALTRQENQVRSLVDQLQARVREAAGVAQQAGVKVRALQAAAKAAVAAKQREQQRVTLLSGGPTSQWEARLLALLGPSEGRGCTIPSGLRDTGQRISGDASWYGGAFAGGPTASGAIFDPSLFTAAHRTLPLGVFLRVHYGGNCAIVLVNDRGPYGNYQRVIDLAHAPARYLGIGVAHVTADVLVPR